MLLGGRVLRWVVIVDAAVGCLQVVLQCDARFGKPHRAVPVSVIQARPSFKQKPGTAFVLHWTRMSLHRGIKKRGRPVTAPPQASLINA